jgi:hypothetical protein
MAYWQKVGPFQGFINLHLALGVILLMNDATRSSTICVSIYGAWLSATIILHTYTSSIAIAHHRAWLLMEFEFC